ncbi:MAG: fibronectin type III domain-containing protein, partial [Ilumatobacteraceae bacterium]
EGLGEGVSYTFAVAAKSSAATSAASASSDAVTVYETPGVPSGVTGVAGVGEVEVSWVAPSSLGLPAASEFVVTATPDDGSSVVVVSCVGSPCTVEGLGEGVSYTFAVAAKSSVATSAASASSDAVTVLTAPGAPTGVSAVVGVGEAVVSWVAPVELGDPELSEFVVTATPGGAQCTVAAPSLSCTVEGLTGGVSYTFAVAAKSSAATSAASASSDAVTVGQRQTPEGPIYEPDGLPPALGPGDVVVRESAELRAVVTDSAGSEVFSLGEGSEIGAQLLREDRELVLEPVGDVGDAAFEVRLSANCGVRACEVETGTDASGNERHVLRLNAEGGSAQLSGEGFLPGSTVRLWIFSDPTFVTEVQVADDGTFVGSAPLIALPNGDHTVQVNGVSFDGLYRSATVGVRLDDYSEALPSTGAGGELLPAIILVLAMGALGLLLQRSRWRPTVRE